MFMCLYVKRSHTMWKNSLLIGNEVENEGLGACPQEKVFAPTPSKTSGNTLFQNRINFYH